MRVLGDSKHQEKSFWAKTLLKKLWFSSSSKRAANDFNSVHVQHLPTQPQHPEETNLGSRQRHSCSTDEHIFRRSSSIGAKPKGSGIISRENARHSSAGLMEEESEILKLQFTEKHHLRVFVGTWNVGGKTPEESMDLEEWLGSKDPADIYVLGFQEIVPLNAGNVLGAEDHLPAVRWLNLIQNALGKVSLWNNMRRTSSFPLPQCKKISAKNEYGESESFKLGECPISMRRSSRRLKKEETPAVWSNNHCKVSPISSQRSMPTPSSIDRFPGYGMVASKQMVGIFVTIWVRGDLRQHVHDLKLSCVGRGLMGYFGNKGSISISMRIHQTTFCFICSHLSSGEREGDECRRNSDVSFILKRTQFPRTSGVCLPETILEHDRIIWFGDLNYRLALSSNATRTLLAKEDWGTLLERDQLQIERRAGRVFEGWKEGNIYFAPTYKYRMNSDRYTLEKGKLGEKRRVPAWCDRILWFGKGLQQLAYVRGESRLSDHRPVHSLFSVEVDVFSRRKLEEFFVSSTAKQEEEEEMTMEYL